MKMKRLHTHSNQSMTYRSFLARKYGCWGGVAMDDLAQHDKRFHPDGYKEGDSCKLRERLKESDSPDADVKPTQKTTPEAEYEAVVAAYTNPDGSKKPVWMKAPNGKDSNLTERQWVQVRTPSFKKWFGDWETLARISEVKRLQPVELSEEDYVPNTKEELKNLFSSFGEVRNSFDGCKVTFPRKVAGKVRIQSGVKDIGRFAPAFKEAFMSAVPAFTETPYSLSGHKDLFNYSAYRHYVGKIRNGDGKFYVRFTITEENHGKRDEFHASTISDISVYEQNGAASSGLGTKPSGNTAPFVDNKLSNWFCSVNPQNVSKIVDENGEPKVVYHGTAMEISRFYPGLDNVIWTTPSRKYAEVYADPARHPDPENDGWVMELFVCAKNVADIGDINVPYDDEGVGRIASAAGGTAQELAKRSGTYSYGYLYELNEHLVEMAKANGFDGFAAIEGGLDEWGGGYPEKVATIGVFRDTQIKSAFDNTGSFSASDPDIRH